MSGPGYQCRSPPGAGGAPPPAGTLDMALSVSEGERKVRVTVASFASTRSAAVRSTRFLAIDGLTARTGARLDLVRVEPPVYRPSRSQGVSPRDATLETDLRREAVETWLVQRASENLSGRTRNSYLQAIRGLCNWCVETGRRVPR